MAHQIQITQEGERWIARFPWSHETKDIVKAAGFIFDGKRKVWYTHKPEIAARLTPEGQEQLAREAAERAEAVQRHIEASRAVAADIDIPAPEGLSYLPYQRAGIAYALARPNTLIGDEMGLGKTIQAIGLINADPTIRSVLVICPASLKLNWVRELRKWLTRPMRVAMMSGAGRVPEARYADILVVNYDIVSKIRAGLDARTWDLVVADECHYLKNPKADRTRAVLGGRATRAKSKDKPGKPAIDPLQANRRLMMTGTPICNRPIELWPLVESLDPNGLGANFMRYARRYCGAHQNGWGWDFSGASHLDELQAALRGSIMVRRLKADVLTELPPKRRQIIQLEATGVLGDVVAREAAIEQRHEDVILAARAAVELAKADSDAAYERAVTDLTAATQIAFAEMSQARHELAVAKAPLVAEHITAMLEEIPKVVVMAVHHDVIDTLRAHFPDSVVVDGRVPIEARQAAVDRFQTDPTCRVFIGNIRAAGVGLTLTAASTVIFAELDWTPGNISQAEDRCHRIGQRDSVLVQHIVVDGSLDARMALVLVEKQDVIDRALDRECAAAPQPAAPAEIELVDALPPPVPRGARATEPRDGRAATRDVKREALRAYGERMTDEQIAAVHAGLRMLAGLDADHAMEQNQMGFNKLDGRIGHDLAERRTLTRTQAALGRKLLLKYRRQLGDDLAAQIRGAPEE